MIEIVSVTDAQGAVIAPDLLAAAEQVHRQLRPNLPPLYAQAMAEIFADTARMCVAVVEKQVAGIAVYRFMRNTHVGLKLYVDDLVTDATQRSRGVGHALLAHLEQLARSHGAHALSLDSGTQRQQAHKFYFREGFVVTSFSFNKALS